MPDHHHLIVNFTIVVEFGKTLFHILLFERQGSNTCMQPMRIHVCFY